jgi:hypothetical protein
MPTTIDQADLIESVAGALQFISHYHPADFIAHLSKAYERERSDVAAQLLPRLAVVGRAAHRRVPSAAPHRWAQVPRRIPARRPCRAGTRRPARGSAGEC